MNNLIEEYSRYNDLVSKKQALYDKISSLAGKNDSESILEINEIAKKINEVNSDLHTYNQDDVKKIKSYLNSLEEVNKVVEDIKYIEKITKKTTHDNDKVEVLSAEGRKKYIDPEYVEQYKNLAERKKEIRKENINHYNKLKNIQTIVNKKELTEEIVPEKTTYILPELEEDKNLTVEEQIQDIRESIERIIKSAKLPNMGKKVLITYDEKKYTIPEKYHGRFKNAQRNLNKLLNSQNKIEPNENIINKEITQSAVLNPSSEKTISSKEKITLPAVNQIINNKNKYTIIPRIKVSFKNEQRFLSGRKLANIDKKILKNAKKFKGHLIDKGIEIKKGYVNFKQGVSQKYNGTKSYITSIPTRTKKYFAEKAKPVLNIDKKIEKNAKKFKGHLIDKGIEIKKGYVNFKQGVSQKYNGTKSYITSIPTRTKKFINERVNNIKSFFQDKKDIVEGIRNHQGIKKSMEYTYGDKKENHLDYRIVNRTVNFKENTCHRIEETTTKIVTIGKELIDKIKAPFNRLREVMNNDVERQRLIEEIKKIEQENKEKIEAFKRIRVKQSGGYVAFGSLIVVSTLALSAIIFTIISALLNR